MLFMLITLLVFQPLILPLKFCAPENIPVRFFTLLGKVDGTIKFPTQFLNTLLKLFPKPVSLHSLTPKNPLSGFHVFPKFAVPVDHVILNLLLGIFLFLYKVIDNPFLLSYLYCFLFN